MRKLILCLAGVSGWLFASMAYALAITINGVTYNVDSFSITQNANGASLVTSPVIVLGDGGEPGGETPPVEEPPPPPPPPPPGTGTCVESASQVCAGTIDWASPGGRLRTAVPGTTTTVSWVFTTTGNPSYSGDVNISETTGFEMVNRHMWISTEPGGQALPSSRCSTEGVSGRKINWAQQANFLRCSLQPNSTYFLNVKNLSGCSSAQSCGLYRNIGTSGNP